MEMSREVVENTDILQTLMGEFTTKSIGKRT